jgi:hypothetical protein
MASITTDSSIPFDLKGFGEKKLEKLDVSILRTLCSERNIPIKAKSPKKKCMKELLTWKNNGKVVQTKTSTTSTKGSSDKVHRSSEMSSIPNNLSGYGEAKLLKFDLKTLQKLCKDRKLHVKASSQKKTLVTSLLKWKTNSNSAPTVLTNTTTTSTGRRTVNKNDTKELTDQMKAMKIENKKLQKQLNHNTKDLTNQVKAMKIENKNLQKQFDKLMKQFIKLKNDTAMPKDQYGFTKRDQFRNFLRKNGFNISGQDVHHIIASHNGGCDHVDNYLYTAGQGYNRGHGANFDALHCRQAGLQAVERAIAACKLAERLKHGVEDRGKNGKVVYWSHGPHAGKTAKMLVAEGSNWFRDARRLHREEMKNK